MDAADPLAAFRDRFVIDDDVIYLDGNSLGRLPRATPPRIAELVAQEWGRVIGAAPGEVLVTDTTSVDLFKLLGAVLQAEPRRRVLLTEQQNFPTDLYVADGLTRLLASGHKVRAVPRDALRDALDADVAVLTLTHVDFRTAEVHDMAALTAAAHDAGARVVWDLSHSCGAIPVDVSSAGVDLATGCGYKYLNGGPGAPAYLFVSRRLQEQLGNPIQGWLGHESPFTFVSAYRPAAGIRRWMSGSPPVIGIAALEVAIEMFLEADMRRVGAKASQLTELFIRLADARLTRHGFEVASPRDAARRGAQVSLRHPDGYAVIRALIDHKVIGDFRTPDLCRFGFAPLYTRFVDVWDAAERIVSVIESGEHRRAEYAERAFIT
ncbi:MAG: aminotransferase class V-fold PLP-dependent enzyme [Chloroflexi bacterium]|nr:MAG: aminotransferase class V-fold PLP-dependent enzyme [Chloroflexota bacterium]